MDKKRRWILKITIGFYWKLAQERTECRDSIPGIGDADLSGPRCQIYLQIPSANPILHTRSAFSTYFRNRVHTWTWIEGRGGHTLLLLVSPNGVLDHLLPSSSIYLHHYITLLYPIQSKYLRLSWSYKNENIYGLALPVGFVPTILLFKCPYI